MAGSQVLPSNTAGAEGQASPGENTSKAQQQAEITPQQKAANKNAADIIDQMVTIHGADKTLEAIAKAEKAGLSAKQAELVGQLQKDLDFKDMSSSERDIRVQELIRRIASRNKKLLMKSETTSSEIDNATFLEDITDPNSKVILVSNPKDIQHIVDLADSIPGRKIGLDLDPVQLKDLLDGKTPMGIDPSKGQLLLAIAHAFPSDSLVAYGSYRVIETDKTRNPKDSGIYRGNQEERARQEAEHLMQPYLSSPGEVAEVSGAGIVAFFTGAQIKDDLNTPATAEQIASNIQIAMKDKFRMFEGQSHQLPKAA